MSEISKPETYDRPIKDLTDRELAEETLAHLRNAVVMLEQVASSPMLGMLGGLIPRRKG